MPYGPDLGLNGTLCKNVITRIAQVGRSLVKWYQSTCFLIGENHEGNNIVDCNYSVIGNYDSGYVDLIVAGRSRSESR